MFFNSIEFLLFFPLVTLLYYIIPHKIRYLWLLSASYYFYMCWNPKYALLMALSTGITFFSGILIHKSRTVTAKKYCVAGSFISNLAILFFFKYFNFTSNILEAVLNRIGIGYDVPTLSLLLPVGISFYTFQALSYTIDIYRGDLKPEKNIAKYALFVSFFPQLVAGPIERSKNLLPQFDEIHKFDFERVKSGLQIMLWGLFQKMVIADRAALFVNEVYNNIHNYNGVIVVGATIFFAFQIYCDFAGYSNIAIGAARVLGFNLMNNFNNPYFATSIPEFWKRWHISLTSWFRDYLYIPLGGNRKGQLRKYINIAIVFIVSGLWHGASLNFVVWGLIHAIMQIVSLSTEKKRGIIRKKIISENIKRVFSVFRVLVTFGLVCFAWVFFRANSLSQAFVAINNMFVPSGVKSAILGANSISQLMQIYQTMPFAHIFTLQEMLLVIFSVALMLVVEYIRQKHGLRKRFEAMPLVLRWAILYSLMFAIIIFGVYGETTVQQFIYFQF